MEREDNIMVRTPVKSLSQNNCLPDKVCRAVADGPPILGGFLPIPAAFASTADRQAGVGYVDLVPVDGLDVEGLGRVEWLNALGSLQPEFDGHVGNDRLRIIEGVPTRLWEKWEKIAGGMKP